MDNPQMSEPGQSHTASRFTPWPMQKAQSAIVVAGCLAMAYTQLTMSPACIQIARDLGATGFHIGILGALPTGMLFLQFLAALVVNHLRFRRKLWMAASILERLVLVPVAIGAWLMPTVSDNFWMWALLIATAANYGLLHFATPLWLSWMGDYLPHEGLNRFWGRRHLWMQFSAAASLAFGAFFLVKSGIDIRPAFAVLITAGAVMGLVDIFLFLKVEEPPVRPLQEPDLRSVLSAPFKHAGFRSYISYSSFFNFAAMIGSPFISLFLLDYVGMSLFYVLLLWAFSWFGGAVLSQKLGHLAELHGSRPVLVLCTAFKGINMLALLVIPQEPTLAFWILAPIFMVDALLNAGIAIASNGFILKNSPSENRSMYIAAGTALAGMVGGVTSIVAGIVLAGMGNWTWTFAGWTFVGYHAIFAASFVLRVVSTLFAARMSEPETTSARQVVTLLIGATPLRVMRFPVGLYRDPRSPAAKSLAGQSRNNSGKQPPKPQADLSAVMKKSPAAQ